MKSLTKLSTILLAILPAAAPAQTPDNLVVIGAGWVGDWDTQIDLADPPAAGGTTGSIQKFIVTVQPCIECGTSFALPENGAARFLASEILGDSFEGPQLLRLSTDADAPLPITRARIFRRTLPCQSADLPVLRESTLRAADTGALVFPGLERDPATRSNLILQVVGPDNNTDVTIEAFDAQGALVGQMTATVPAEAAFQALTLVDVVALLGGDQIDNGRLVVTRTSGSAVIWGVLATYAQDGALTMSGGLNP